MVEMDLSLEIPSENSQDFSPVQNLEIEINPIFLRPHLKYQSSESVTTKRVSTTDSVESEHNTQQKLLHKIEEVNLDDSPIAEWNRIETKFETFPSIINKKGHYFKSIENFSYENTFFKEPNCDLLVGLFLEELVGLKSSDAKGVSFELDKCLGRLRKKPIAFLFDFLTGKPKEIEICADFTGFQYKNGRRTTKVYYKDIQGIVYGNKTSTFRKFEKEGGFYEKFNLYSEDCVSIITEFSTHNFGISSEKTKYDFCLVVSWFASALSKFINSLPISKGKLAIFSIKEKLVEMAEERKVFFNELIILAMIKSCILRNEHSKVKKLKRILNRKFSNSMKIFRLALKFKPSGFRSSDRFVEKFGEIVRNVEISERMAERFVQVEQSRQKRLAQWRKATNREGFMDFTGLKKLIAREKQKPQLSDKYQPDHTMFFRSFVMQNFSKHN